MFKAGNKEMKTQLHCPVQGCLYYEGSERHFTAQKFLKQHIAKVHGEKKFLCGRCGKGFGSDWWCHHHEKTCGMRWQCCACQKAYDARETLLTHCRRTGHKLPPEMLPSNRKKSSKAAAKLNDQPVIILIQSFGQNITSLQQPQKQPTKPQQILPSPIYVVSPNQMNISLDAVTVPSRNEVNAAVPENEMQKPQALQKSIGTQTSPEVIPSIKTRESQASQCYRRRSKKSSHQVINTSTHTQTAESAVVKIKRRRSRKKSVAITTEPSTFTSTEPDLSLWPDFKDLILPDPRTVKSSSGTQTTTNKVLCDSQTVTDDEIFKFVFGPPKNNGIGDFSVQENISDSSPVPYIFANESVIDKALEGAVGREEMDLFQDAESTAVEALSLLSGFPPTSSEVPPPMQLDIHTQTMASTILDYNLLANMETQTTDDFNLLLEFSDCETQTPWADLSSIDDSPLPADQLSSIEIQTDFSSFASGINHDPFSFLQSFNLGEPCGNKEATAINSETQTSALSFPEFTNTESQTLDISHLFCSTLNS